VSVAGLPAAFLRERRRSEAIAKGLNGIDFIDVADDRQTLSVYFFLSAPKDTRRRDYRISGGTHVRDIKVVEVLHASGDDPEHSDCLLIRVDRKGDYSNYRFEVVEIDGFDPLFGSVTFTFGRAPGITLDCASVGNTLPAAAVDEPNLDYLAKDFDSFRQVILDRFALNVPTWTETHLSDIGVTLVELLAYVGDQLSYYQDAIATEAYLDTARLRISARRHARLVDYAIQEGCNARAWMSIEWINNPKSLTFTPGEISFTTSLNSAAFEPVADTGFTLLQAYSSLDFYTWGDTIRTLPAGAMSATLCDTVGAHALSANVRSVPTGLQVGGVLIFEEVIGPASGSPLDADPAHRCAVRLVCVNRDQPVDPVTGTRIVEIGWGVEDRLPFTLTLTAQNAQGDLISNVSVARGNVVLVDHGATLPTAESIGTVSSVGAFRPKLAQPNLTYRAPANVTGSARATMIQDPRAATPQIIALTSTVTDLPPTTWTARYDLLESGADANDYVVEMDDDRVANLRFGDGTLGAQPEPGAAFSARYRIGNGIAGNVGADTIVQMNVQIAQSKAVGTTGLRVRNPLAATGGTEPEPISQIKLLAPQAASTLYRAVTPADYASIAQRNPAVFQAAAVLRWSGLRQAVRVAIDPVGTETVSGTLLAAIAAQLETVRSIGQDVEVVPATYVPIDLALGVAVVPGYLQGHVASVLRKVFSNRVLADGTLGFFNPQNLGFGQNIYESNIVAAALAVTGVQTVTIHRLARLLDEEEGLVPAGGVLALNPLELARLDNDPSAPENGRFHVVMSGGR
jgi:hypothetical protein